MIPLFLALGLYVKSYRRFLDDDLLDRVSKRYRKGSELLTETNLLIPDGVMVGVLGEKGVGKSVFIRMLAGIELPSHGRIHIEGTSLWQGNIDSSFHPNITLIQGLRFFGRLYHEEDSRMEPLIHRALEWSEAERYGNTLWKKVPQDCKQLIRFSLLALFESDKLFLDGPPFPQGHPEIERAMRERIKSATTILANPNLKRLENFCEAGIVIREKRLHYFDSIEEAIQFHTSEKET